MAVYATVTHVHYTTGCGVGLDMLLMAARCPDARCVGIDLTPAMCLKAQKNAGLCGHSERIAVLQGSVDCAQLSHKLQSAGHVQLAGADLVTSNGVFNLCVDKRQAFLNAFSLLKPGGVLLLVDMVRELGEGTPGGSADLAGTSWAD